MQTGVPIRILLIDFDHQHARSLEAHLRQENVRAESVISGEDGLNRLYSHACGPKCKIKGILNEDPKDKPCRISGTGSSGCEYV